MNHQHLKIVSATVYTPSGPIEIKGEDVRAFAADARVISYTERSNGAERIITCAGCPIVIINEVSPIARM